MKKFCCESFEQAFENQNKKGLSIAVSQGHDNKPVFLLVFRAVEQSGGGLLKQTDGFGQPSACLVSEHVLSFCPWCGKKLRRYYWLKWEGMLSRSIMDP